MGRNLRPRVAGGTYHVTARGVRKQPIYGDDADRKYWLATLAGVVAKHELICHSYCELENHFHAVLGTPHANLAEAMHELNSDHAHWFNWRYGLSGHVFEARYWSKLIEDDVYFCRVARYIARNPVRAGICARPQDWAWSSYAATIGEEPAPPFLSTERLLAQFGRNAAEARLRYRAFVGAGADDRLDRDLSRRDMAVPGTSMSGAGMVLRGMAR